MIEMYTPDDIRRYTGQELRVAPRITDNELAITGEIPLFPAVFHLVNGVLAGDTTYTQQLRSLQEWGTAFNSGLSTQQKINVEDPAAILSAAEQNRKKVPFVDRLLSEHEQFGAQKRELVRTMRAETIAGLTVISDGVERIDEMGMVPLFVEEFQISALALLIRARRELDTGNVLLGPVDEDTRLISAPNSPTVRSLGCMPVQSVCLLKWFTSKYHRA